MKALQIFVTLIVGLLGGLAYGLLTAPDKGEKTKKKLKKDINARKRSLDNRIDGLEHKLNQILERARSKVEERKESVEEFIDRQAEKGKDAINKANKSVQSS